MRVQPIASPTQVPQATGVPQDRIARAKAIAAGTGEARTQAPAAMMDGAVMSQNAVSPEEMGALQQPIDASTSTEDTQVAETAPEPAEEKQADPALSRQFAQLARQEKALRAKALQQEQAYKAREAALLQREQEIAAKNSSWDPTAYIPKERLRQDTIGTLNAELGMGYDEITQQALNRVPTDPRIEAHIQRLEAKLAEMEKHSQSQVKAQEEAQQSQYQAAVKQIETDTKHLVYTDPSFETIKNAGAVKDVVELIVKTHKETGEIMSIQDAAQQVEDYLVDEYMKVYEKTNKFKQRLQSVAPTSPAKTQTPSAPAKQTQPSPSMKTLTNATASTRQLSAKERAVLAFKGQLK